MSDATPDRELIPPQLTSQERQLINLLRESPLQQKYGYGCTSGLKYHMKPGPPSSRGAVFSRRAARARHDAAASAPALPALRDGDRKAQGLNQ